MRKYLLLLSAFLISLSVMSQKKALDHSVYDGWQSIGRKTISNDGKWIVYNIDVQEGDNELVIQSADASYKKIIPRGYSAQITEDSRYVVFKISPLFKDTREAKIKKKKPADQPKDSIAIMQLGKDSVWKKADVKTFKTPEKSFGWVAYHLEKSKEAPGKKDTRKPEKFSDSLTRVIDSLQNIIETQAASISKQKEVQQPLPKDISTLTDADDDPTPGGDKDEGTDLVLRNLLTNEEKTFFNVTDYLFNKEGGKILMHQSAKPRDSLSRALVILYDVNKKHADTLSRGGNDFKGLTISDDGSQVAYAAERDAKPKALQKLYKLWYFKSGMDSAKVLADNSHAGIEKGMTVSENGRISFSKSGKKLQFGTAPISTPKDTTLVDIDLVKLDIWHYKDDYLQTVQLSRLRNDLRKNFMAVIDLESGRLMQMESEEIPNVYTSAEGDGDLYVGVTDFGRRTESQWTGNTKKDIYLFDFKTGTKKLIESELEGFVSPSMISPSGKYVMWYDSKLKNYFVHDGNKKTNLTANMTVPLHDEDHDQPSDPSPHGLMGWHNGDNEVLVYDKFDIWKIDVTGKAAPENITNGEGRKNNITYRYVRTDPDERFINPANANLLRVFNNDSKKAGLALWQKNKLKVLFADQPFSFGSPDKAKNAPVYVYTKENYEASPDLFVYPLAKKEIKLSATNPQQSAYNWGTAELYSWTTFSGKPSKGILYKPEDFDATKKYPVILYFYEKLSDGLYRYQAPAPTPSRLNISFFVSRGYIVFAPDIAYTIGYPAKSAYDYIVSGTESLVKNSWIDAANIGIQGQSWGGIQVAQLITMTDIYKAAWAGAPVANMTSAYGGIRWERGMNRQFQYEKTQSRIGATLWEKPELYIENSPLFHLPKVKTPLVIMANDADGAVPWYQGIELFTGMVRLGKEVWMLNYNGEAHNLVQRKNRKDIQIREQQFFDWLLKGAKPAKWIVEGLPAVKKGADWGLDLVH